MRGVIFDMDGVLCDSEPFITEAACRLFAERHGACVQPSDFEPFVGAGEDRFLGGVAEKYGIKLNLPSDKERTYEIYLSLIPGRLHALPGACAFVAECRRRGLRTAVATSADRIKLEGNLREIGLPASSFDACVTGSEVERKKPYPDLFLLAAERIGLPAAACLVIEDAPSGIRAACAAGARCLGITSSFPAAVLQSAGAEAVAADLSEWPRRLIPPPPQAHSERSLPA